MGTKAMLIDEGTGEVTEVPTEVVSKEWYRRPANYKHGQFDKDNENCEGKSLTVPSQSYTIREILQKFTRGIPMDIQNEGEYDNIDEFDNSDTENAIDITDVEEQLTAVNERISYAKSRSVKAKQSAATTTKEEDANDVKPGANNLQS